MSRYSMYLVILGGLGVSPNVSNAQQCNQQEATGFQYPFAGWQTNGNGFWSDVVEAFHLGADSTPGQQTVGHPIESVCTGIVKDASSHRGYGGTVIVQCWTGEECVSALQAHMFHVDTVVNGTLYRGLQVRVNDLVRKGEVIGYLADRANNGGWVPHDHLGIRKGPFLNGQTCDRNRWTFAGYGLHCVRDDWHDPDIFIPAHRAPVGGYLVPPESPNTLFTCSLEPEGSADTGWVYSCPWDTGDVHLECGNVVPNQRVYGVFRIDDVQVNHTFRALLYKRNPQGDWIPNSPRQHIWQNDQVEADGGWQYSHFWPFEECLTPGDYQWRFYVDVGAGFPNNPDHYVAAKEFRVAQLGRVAAVPDDNGEHPDPNHPDYEVNVGANNPITCGDVPTGGEHTNWVYACRDRRNVFAMHEHVYGLVRVDNIYVDHRFKVRTYRNGNFEWESQGEWVRGVPAEWGWAKTYYWTHMDNASAGDWQFRFYIDTGNGFGANPIATADFSVEVPPYRFNDDGGQNPYACPNEPTGGAHTDWVYSCNRQQLFSPGDDVYGLIRINDVFAHHRFRTRTYRNGVFQWAWDEPDLRQVDLQWGWNLSYFWSYMQNAARGDWEVRYYIDTGNGFPQNEDSDLARLNFSVVAPPFSFNDEGGNNPKVCGDLPLGNMCNDQRNVFPHGQRIYSVIRISDIFERPRFKVRSYHDGVFDAEASSNWYAVNQDYGTQHINYVPQFVGLASGNWQLRFYVDVGDGFPPEDQPLAQVDFRVEAPPPPPQDCHGGRPLWDWSYCTDHCPCEVGQGDCDRDSQCAPGLFCRMNVGNQIGQHLSMDICDVAPEQPADCHRQPLWGWAYCTADCPCAEDEGDCDNNDECAGDLVCVHDVGNAIGQHRLMDVCRRPGQNCQGNLPLWHWDYCNAACPCAEGQGDCDNNNECAGNLICRHNIGDQYGRASSIDVCVQP